MENRVLTNSQKVHVQSWDFVFRHGFTDNHNNITSTNNENNNDNNNNNIRNLSYYTPQIRHKTLTPWNSWFWNCRYKTSVRTVLEEKSNTQKKIPRLMHIFKTLRKLLHTRYGPWILSNTKIFQTSTRWKSSRKLIWSKLKKKKKKKSEKIISVLYQNSMQIF